MIFKTERWDNYQINNKNKQNMSTIINDLNWRYATKKFDATKKVSTEDLEKIKEILRLTPTSYGIQGMKFIFVKDSDLRSKIQAAGWNQAQITEASDLLVLCYNATLNDSDIDGLIQLVSDVRGVATEHLKGYSDMMKGTLANLTEEQKGNWLAKQVYIALGQLLTGLAALKIDATPMEGFDASQVDEILELDKLGLKSVLLCPIGYRHSEDESQHGAKVRYAIEDLFIEK